MKLNDVEFWVVDGHATCLKVGFASHLRPVNVGFL